MIGGLGSRLMIPARALRGPAPSISPAIPAAFRRARGPPEITVLYCKYGTGPAEAPLAQANQAPTGVITEGSRGMTQTTSAATARKGAVSRRAHSEAGP